MSTGTLYVAATTDDGRVHASSLDLPGGGWSPFSPISSLNRPGFQNQSTSVSPQSHIATVDDSAASELRCSFKTSTGWSPALSVASGIGLAKFNKSPFVSGEVLGLGGPETAGWSFGLPMFWVQAAKVDRAGDAASRLEFGDLDPSDLPAAFDFSGSLGSDGSGWGFLLCLATESGGLYFADIPKSGTAKITNLKATAAGDPGPVISVACTWTEVCVVNDAGKIRHTSRRPDGTWLPFGDVSAATRSTETFRQISVLHTVEFGGAIQRLHLLGVTTSGGLLHTYRTIDNSPDPVWSPFIDVKAKAGNPGYVTSADFAGNYIPG